MVSAHSMIVSWVLVLFWGYCCTVSWDTAQCCAVLSLAFATRWSSTGEIVLTNSPPPPSSSLVAAIITIIVIRRRIGSQGFNWCRYCHLSPTPTHMTLSDEDKPESPSDVEMLPCRWDCCISNVDIGCGGSFPRRDFGDVSAKGIKPDGPRYFGVCMDCFAGRVLCVRPGSQQLQQPQKRRKPAAATAGNSDSAGDSDTTRELHTRELHDSQKKRAFEKKPAVKKKADVKKRPASMQASSSKNPSTMKKKPVSMQPSSTKKPSTMKKKPVGMQASSSESELNGPNRKTTKKQAASPADPYWPRASDRQ